MSWPCARLRSWLCRSQRLIWRRMDGLLVWVVVCPHTAPQHLPESRTTYPGQQILLFFGPAQHTVTFEALDTKTYRWKGTNLTIDLNAWLPSSTEFVNWFLLACFEFNSICFFIISGILEQLGVGSSSDSWGYPERERLVVRDLATLCLSKSWNFWRLWRLVWLLMQEPN